MSVFEEKQGGQSHWGREKQGDNGRKQGREINGESSSVEPRRQLSCWVVLDQFLGYGL